MNDTNKNEQEAVIYQTGKDAMSSVFIVSVLLNLAVFIAWLIVTTNANYAVLVVNR